MTDEELNIALAEKLGFRVFRPADVKWRDKYHEDNYAWDKGWSILAKKKRPQTHMIDAKPLPDFCSSISYAMEVLDKIRASDYWCCIEFYSDHHYIWEVKFTESDWSDDAKHEPIIRISNESLPRAIAEACLAALELQPQGI